MTSESLKAVFTLNEEGTFSPSAHNLTEKRATAKAAKLEEEGKKVKVLEQTSVHHGCRSFKDCKQCQNAAQNLSQSSPGQILPEKGETLDEGSEESET